MAWHLMAATPFFTPKRLDTEMQRKKFLKKSKKRC